MRKLSSYSRVSPPLPFPPSGGVLLVIKKLETVAEDPFSKIYITQGGLDGTVGIEIRPRKTGGGGGLMDYIAIGGI